MAVPPGTVILDNPPIRVRQCRHGAMLYHLNDAYVGRSLDVYGEYSELEAQLFCHILRPGMTAIDVGANIGAFTVPMARAVFPGGAVVAIEPQRALHQMLCANAALNGLRNVRALQAGAGRAQGRAVAPRIDLMVPRNFGAFALTESGVGEVVDIVSIDALGLTDCHFMKIDVEGTEAAVVHGAAETIARCRPILYVENAYADKSPALIEQLLALNLRLYRHVPPLFNHDNFFAHHQDIFNRVASYNMLCVPRESANQPTGEHEIHGPADCPLDLVGTK